MERKNAWKHYTAKDIKIVYNRYGKDFGVKEQAVTKVF